MSKILYIIKYGALIWMQMQSCWMQSCQEWGKKREEKPVLFDVSNTNVCDTAYFW